MNKKKTFLVGAVALTLFAACSEQQDAYEGNPSNFIRIGASTLDNGTVITRTPYDGTGSITAANPLAAYVPVSKSDGNYSALYTDANGNRGTKITWISGSATLFDIAEYSYPTTGEKVYMVGLAPYTNWAASALSTTATNYNPIDGKTDLMAAPQLTASSTDKNKVLKFAHLGTKLNLLIKAANANAITHWGTITGIELTQADGATPPTKATVTLKTGAATWSATGAAPLNAYKYDGTTYSDTKLTSATLQTTAKMVGYIIAPPVNVDSGSDYVLHVNATGNTGEQVFADIPIDVALPAGAAGTSSQGYAYNITLNFTGGVANGDILVGSDVANWNTGTAVNGPSVNTTINLSANGTSNSYIINSTDATYQFDATVMGNGVIPASQSDAKVITSATIAKNAAYKAVVLWSTGSSISSVVQNVTYNSSTGLITFNTPAKSSMLGNAVIALKDGNNKILWSWHIWRTSYNPSANGMLDTYNINVGDSIKTSVRMMKFNLGCTQMAATMGANVYESGLIYQWGRKDPFLSAKGTSGNVEPVKGEDYFIDAAGATDFKVAANSKQITADGDAKVTTAISNPMTFYRQQSGGDWLASGTQAIKANNDLWGNPGSKSYVVNKNKGTKSMFDPCPPGYMVPPAYTWANGSGTNVHDGMMFTIGTVSAYYPYSGSRFSTDGTINTGTYANSMSSSPAASAVGTAMSDLYFASTGGMFPFRQDVRAYGMPVRCCAQ